MTEVLALWVRLLLSERTNAMEWVEEGCAPVHVHGTVLPQGQPRGRTTLDPWDRVQRYRRKSLAQLRGGEGWAAAGHSPWQLPGISVSCSTAAHELSQRITGKLVKPETGVPLSPQASPPYFGRSRGLSVTVSWGRGGWSVCVEAVLEQCQSPRWGSNLLDTLPALALVPQGNIELLARCLSPPSMPPLPAYRTPVALTREQWEFLLCFPFPLGFISIWIFLPLISSLRFLLFNRIKLLFTALDFLPEEEFTGYKQAVFKLFSLLLSCDKFIEPEDTHCKGFASLSCVTLPSRYLRTSEKILCHLPKLVCLSSVLRQTHPLISCHPNMFEQMNSSNEIFDFSFQPWLI